MRHNNFGQIKSVQNNGISPQADSGSNRPSHENKRRDPRVELVAQAFVSMVPLNSRAFQIREISRGGMFLEFRDVNTSLDMGREHIDVGTDVEIAFAVFMDESRHTFNVRARIARLTRAGIGVQFLTRNPPQLGALRDIFETAPEGSPKAQKDPVFSVERGSRRVVLQKPADDSGWQDWELI